MGEMRAVVVSQPGSPDVLQLRSVSAPSPGRGEVRVQVRAAGINRADLLQRRGLYPAPPGWPQDIPGLEYAGVVESVGEGVASCDVGDAVMGLVGGGGYAEYVVVAEREVIPVPGDLSFEQAAAIPEVFITAHDALFAQLHLGLGERLLIHAVGSGVGTAALQLAKASGVKVLGTSRTGWKLERAREFGLDVAIDTSRDEFAPVVRDATGGAGVDVVLDLVGGAYLAGNLEALSQRGRMIVVGLTSGRTAEIDLGTLLRKRLCLVGTSLRSRHGEEKIAVAQAFRHVVSPLFADGRVQPIVDRVFPLDEAAEAHRRMESNENFGKLVLTVGAW